MKAVLIIIALMLSACSTINQAKKDFRNFRKTIAFNSKQEVVYPCSQF